MSALVAFLTGESPYNTICLVNDSLREVSFDLWRILRFTLCLFSSFTMIFLGFFLLFHMVLKLIFIKEYFHIFILKYELFRT
jgi:hypothetical protein